ncbi:MAG TPA: hypothetical protein VME23_18350 [Terracidiphilus sp.]|nr:hypothetical protein [Terracidiphilus sp.]
MPEHENRNLEPGAEFDHLIRSSLETYADPGSDSGLAQRILARIAAEGAREQRRRLLGWAIALPVAACLIVLIVLLGANPKRNSANLTSGAGVGTALPKSSNAGGQGSTAKPPSIAARSKDVSRPQRRSSYGAVTAGATRLPKLDVFPTPQPLTPAEKGLVAYVAHASEAERESLVEERKQMDAPLTIEALEIKPLEPPEPQGN